MNAGHDAFVGLGSNLDGPVDRVIAGAEALATLADTRLVARSPLYGSSPMGPDDQPDYVNAVARLCTGLSPLALLDELQRIEAETGRDRSGERWGPRTLDLDLLLYDDVRRHDERLTLPHPGVTERAFVLVPLADIAPAARLPGNDEPIGRLAARIDRGGLWPLEAIA